MVSSQSTERVKESSAQVDRTSQKSEFESDYKLINDLSIARDFVSLLDLSSRLKEKWANDLKRYSYLQAEISKAFASYDFEDKRQYIYSVELAKDVLKNADDIPIDLEYEMIAKLQSDSAYLFKIAPEEKWEQDRQDRVNLMLHFWNRFQNRIDRNFDFKDLKNRPLGNAPVPAANYPPGIRPEDIKEPDIRAQYEQAIKANQQKATKYNEQIVLHRIDKHVDDFTEKFLINLFSRPPFDPQQIDEILTTLKIDDAERKKKILNAVEEAIATRRPK
jgi:hypothetical protein